MGIWVGAGTMAEADAGGSPGPDLPELQPRPRAQGHRGCACPSTHTLRLGVLCFALPPAFFTVVSVVDRSKIPQKWAQQGFLFLAR